MPRPLTSDPTPPAAAEAPVRVGTEICLYEIGGIKYERTEAPDGSTWQYDAGAGWSDVSTGDLPMLEEIHRLEGVVDDCIHNHETVVHRLMERDAELTTLAARVAELEKERDRYKLRGDQHWETLRSIRHIAQTSGDLKRIAQWVTEAGTGYVDTVEATLAQMTDRALAAEQRVAELEKENETLRAFRDGVATVNMCGGQGTPEAHREIGQFAGLLKKLNDAQERVAAVEREREALRPLAQFGLSLLNEHREWCDDIDGGYVQQAAEDWGLLAHVRAPVACGAECRCREYGLPADCLRETPVMQAARAALAAAPDHMPDAGKMDAVETVAHVLLTDYQCRRPGHGEPGNFYPLARMILAALRTRTPGGARDAR